VPQVVVPLFSFDQAVNGDHVASVGAGVTVGMGGGVATAAHEVTRVLADPGYAEAVRRVASAMRELPPPREAVSVLVTLAG
jgi:UDP:flavonoid glycosyltransferase YjiC (YdhE family)